MDKSRVLFLCVGNSCRSQMAEALVNTRLGDRWEAFSAGSHPEGYVHPLAIKALAEIGINHRGKSKSVDEFRNNWFDLIVILCDQEEDQCPVWLGGGKVIHSPLPDPMRTSGDAAQKLAAYRSVRDRIDQEIIPLLTSS